ncbi:MAG: aminotransferase class V-fold PLP-dependent enzyme [Alphaproteobacteria bacterium]|nr:aminotransferase class V-fold PLP-dependent enzyme [Alphaproteobacteria bacterium]
MSYKGHFSNALNAAPERLHFAAHSHHLWPDVSHDAHMECWNDAARFADRKWERVCGEVIPAVQAHIAHHLRLSKPKNIAFESNTHALVLRLLSCFPTDKPVRVLTTDSEFHSFRRQMDRMEEAGLAEVTRIATQPFETFAQRFIDAIKGQEWDLVFFSQVFFNSGFVVRELERIVRSVPGKETFVVIDGYHGFMAVPTDLSGIEHRAFYLAGGYKYAMAGEGACFLHVPDGYGLRPVNTGWFAAFDALEHAPDTGVAYGANGYRFMGATFDPSGLYRMRAVFDWLKREGISVEDIHAHVRSLQGYFMERLSGLGHTHLKPGNLVPSPDAEERGHFLTFEVGAAAERIHRELLEKHVVTDYRGTRLRFGFGLYHDREDVMRLLTILGNGHE